MRDSNHRNSDIFFQGVLTPSSPPPDRRGLSSFFPSPLTGRIGFFPPPWAILEEESTFHPLRLLPFSHSILSCFLITDTIFSLSLKFLVPWSSLAGTPPQGPLLGHFFETTRPARASRSRIFLEFRRESSPSFRNRKATLLFDSPLV